MSQLFGKKNTLIVYNWMFSPKNEAPCPLCTAVLDGWDGTAPHVMQNVAFAIVGRAPRAKLQRFARGRGWKNLRIFSSFMNRYNHDYLGEKSTADQMPMLNVFQKRGKKIHHFWGTDSLFAKTGDDLDARHVDQFWPLWHLLDATPGGRGEWYPTLKY